MSRMRSRAGLADSAWARLVGEGMPNCSQHLQTGADKQVNLNRIMAEQSTAS